MVIITSLTTPYDSSGAEPTVHASTSGMRSTLSSLALTPTISFSLGPPHPISNQLGRGGGPGWRGAPWVVSLVTVAKAPTGRRRWESHFRSQGLRGQGSIQSRGGDGKADDPDFRQGEAHCPEAATRGTG